MDKLKIYTKNYKKNTNKIILLQAWPKILARHKYHFLVTSSEFWSWVGVWLDKPTSGLWSTWTSGWTSSPGVAGFTGLGRLIHLFFNQLNQRLHHIPWIIRCPNCLYTKPVTVTVTTTVTVTITVTAHCLQEDHENVLSKERLPFCDRPTVPHVTRISILKDILSLLLGLLTTRGQKNLLPGLAASFWRTRSWRTTQTVQQSLTLLESQS